MDERLALDRLRSVASEDPSETKSRHRGAAIGMYGSPASGAEGQGVDATQPRGLPAYMSEQHNVRYLGPRPHARRFVGTLESNGLCVDWTPPKTWSADVEPGAAA